MIAWIKSLPLFVLLTGLAVGAMYIPMAFAIRLEDWLVARTLFYYTTFLMILISLVAIAVTGYQSRNTARNYLVTVFVAFTLVPALLAMPFNFLVPEITYLQAYFEMLSSLTTTGATLFTDPSVLPAPLHLMRALAGWFGGFFMLVVAMSIFAPLQIGGFEIFNAARGTGRATTQIQPTDAARRLSRYARQIFPIYLLVTAILALALMVAGDRVLVAVIHAMAILSTSGISSVGGLSGTNSGYVGEALILFFFVFAISRHTLLSGREGSLLSRVKEDKEVNLALICVIVIPLLLFVRHFMVTTDGDIEQEATGALIALWGGVFTVLSFLTTTGFESAAWDGSRSWSGLGTPGLILMGLAVMGGGIATTAGGIKLLRVYALVKHGQREVLRLRHPNSVTGLAKRQRMIRREAAQVTWVFFMLFLMSLAVTALVLSATGMNLADALVFATAALANTGPLVGAAGSGFTDYASISDTAKAVLCAAMVLGRLEALAVIALLNPNYWR